VVNELDNCPAVANPDQADADGNGVDDACEMVVDKDPPVTSGGDTPPKATETNTAGGCGIASGGDAGPGILLLGLALMARRRRR
jgi:MYXO-CTERM domain-containing protein